jgi:hypothetical protein
MIRFVFYWIKRFFINIFAKDNCFYCPECLGKLKDGNYLIRYETLADHVSDPNGNPIPRTYYYCPNSKCTLWGSAELTDKRNRDPNEMFWDIYGNGDYSSYYEPHISRIQNWKEKNKRTSSYSTSTKGWFFKKGDNAVNSYEARYEYEVCWGTTKIGIFYKKWKQLKRQKVYDEVVRIVGNNNTKEFYDKYSILDKKLKYKVFALIELFKKKQVA